MRRLDCSTIFSAGMNQGLAKWLSEDPLGFAAGDINLGRYVNNSPLMHVDPKGLVGEWSFSVVNGECVTAKSPKG